MALSPSTHLLTPALPPQKIPLACTPTAHSQRGVIVKLTLPDAKGLKAGSTPLMYRGLEVGQLTKLTLNAGGSVTGEMTVDPSVVDLLREKRALNCVIRSSPQRRQHQFPADGKHL